jgi:2-keto-4-pentenoate hydratase/2-oxohepta-3-ene-1,7-dioic acid hydratase in catechol pathway
VSIRLPAMKILRFQDEFGARYGVLEGSDIFALEGSPFDGITVGSRVGHLGEVRLLAPCVPSKIIAVGLNYRVPERDGEDVRPDEPILFLKPPSAVIATDRPIIWPCVSQRIDFEGEVAIVIGKTARKIAPAEARAYLLGVTCANDVTARDLQRREGQWARAKGFDTFCPLGPWIATDLDIASCRLITRVNQEVRQSASTSQLHFSVPELVSYISHVMTLLPGDVILTGTPPGWGPLRIHDVVEVEIEGVGTLRNTVVPDECPARAAGR